MAFSPKGFGNRAISMDRIARKFATLREAGQKALVTFVTAGDPDHGQPRWKSWKGCPAAGADIIELGHALHRPHGRWPGDPGVVACARCAPARPCARRWRWSASFRETDKDDADRSDGLFQSDLCYGRRTLSSARPWQAGVDGLIVVDLPPEEDDELCLPALQARAVLHPAHGAHDHRCTGWKRCSTNTSGFVYYVSIAGITGTRAPDTAAVERSVARIKAPDAAAGRGRLRRPHARAGRRDRRRVGWRGGGLRDRRRHRAKP